ncbi:MAG: hypothetical protein V5A23_01735 [Halobacteriales archaeon]
MSTATHHGAGHRIAQAGIGLLLVAILFVVPLSVVVPIGIALLAKPPVEAAAIVLVLSGATVLYWGTVYHFESNGLAVSR